MMIMDLMTVPHLPIITQELLVVEEVVHQEDKDLGIRKKAQQILTLQQLLGLCIIRKMDILHTNRRPLQLEATNVS